MATAHDVQLTDGATLRVHDSSDGESGHRFTVLWHHGSPQTGALLEPLLLAAAERGVRILSYGRPSYGGSSPRPGRDVASAAADVAAIADSLGVDHFAVMGASGGGPHALACAALLADRVTGVACFASPAPRGGEGLDWFSGMASGGESLRAAVLGREARERYEETAQFDREIFNGRDWALLAGSWSSLGSDSEIASRQGSDGLIEDDLALVAPWGFDVATISAPVLLVHGGDDRVIPPAHGEWLLRNCLESELWLRPRDGHIAILAACPLAMDWLRVHA